MWSFVWEGQALSNRLLRTAQEVASGTRCFREGILQSVESCPDQRQASGHFAGSQAVGARGEATYSCISKWRVDYLGIPFEELDEATLLASEEVKRFYYETQAAISAKDYKGALELLAKALVTPFSENAALRGLGVGLANPEALSDSAVLGSTETIFSPYRSSSLSVSRPRRPN